MTIEKTDRVYTKSTVGKLRFWQGFSEGAEYWSEYGEVNGKVVTAEKRVAKPKNIGKANETTPEEQALNELQAILKKKVKKGYSRDINKAGSVDFNKPMLAKKFTDYGSKIVFGRKSDGKQSLIYSQPKLDGIRCVARADGLWSRTGEKIVSCPHIEEYLEPIFSNNPNIILDGELYNHDLNEEFSKIQSIVRREKLRDGDLEKAEKYIQLHIYDVVDTEKDFFPRIYVVLDILRRIREVREETYVHFVRTQAAMTKRELDIFYRGYQEAGYEGQMVRTNTPYETKRTTALLKRKEFISDEYKILEIQEGVGKAKGKAFNVVLENPNPLSDDPKYATFGAGVIGSHEFCEDVFNNKENYVGKMATVRFFRFTEYGTPFHGKVYAFHLNKRW